MRVLIVDDHEVVRAGLEVAMTAAGYEVVATSATGAEAVRLARRTLPDVAVVDFRLPDTLAPELCRRLRQLLPSLKIVVLTSYLSEETVRGAMAAGAAGYVTKSAGLAELTRTLDGLGESSATRRPGPSQIVKRLHELALCDGHVPTPQQQEVLELAAAGLTNDQIGARLSISESTVRFHIQNLKAKLGARSKTELIARAIRGGLIPPAEEDLASALPGAEEPRVAAHSVS